MIEVKPTDIPHNEVHCLSCGFKGFLDACRFFLLNEDDDDDAELIIKCPECMSDNLKVTHSSINFSTSEEP